MPVYLVNFYRDERAGDDHAEPFGPTFHQPESNALGQEQGRVNEAADPEILDLVRSEGSGLQNGAADVAASRIEAQPRDPLRQDARDVGVNQLESAHTNGDQKNCFQQLEKSNQPDQSGVRGFHATTSS